MQEEPPRLLHRKIEHGYTSVPALSASGEPEAVSVEEQVYQSEMAYARRRAATAEEWLRTRTRIESELALLQARPYSRLVSGEIRDIRRSLGSMQRRLLS